MGAKSSQSKGPGLNKSDGHLLEYLRNNFGAGGGAAIPLPPSGLTATGGLIHDYPDSGTIYRSHTFNASGTFDVTALASGNIPNSVDILLVGGGGGGGGTYNGGAGGGGGLVLLEKQLLKQYLFNHILL